jgi:hypothetical protein
MPKKTGNKKGSQEQKENITLELHEKEMESSFDEYSGLGSGLEETANFSSILEEMEQYKNKYTIKQLEQILEYYGIEKLKSMKMKKLDIVSLIVSYESDPDNWLSTMKRKTMWFYLQELKEDKFMKRFVIY